MNENSLTEKLSQLNTNILDAFNLSTEKDIAEKFIKAGLNILGADFGYCFIKAPGEKKFSLIYITPGVDYVPISKPRKNGIVARAFSTKQPQLIHDVPGTGFIRFDAKSAMESVAVVPITYKNDTYGTLHFAYYEPHNFTEEDKNLYSYLGNSTAQAITINRLYDDLKDFKKTLDNTRDGIFIFDPETLRINYVNNGALSLLQDKRSALTRKNLSEILPSLSEPLLRTKIAEISDTHSTSFLRARKICMTISLVTHSG